MPNSILIQSRIFPAVKRNVMQMPMTMTFLKKVGSAAQFEGILSESLPHWKLDFGSNTPSLHNDMALVLYRCYQMNLRSQLFWIVTKLSSQATKETPTVLGSIYIPFLAVLAHTWRMVHGILSSPLFQFLFQNILSTYASVSNIPPKPHSPHNFAMKACGCGCRPCFDLDSFLQSPTAQTIDFARSLAGRKHLESRIYPEGRHHRTLETVTIQSGSPHTLRVTKIHCHYNYELAEWRRMCEHYTKVVGKIEVEPLKLLLGQHFQTVMRFGPVPFAAIEALVTPQAIGNSLENTAASPNTQGSKVAPHATSNRVVDLTIDTSNDEQSDKKAPEGQRAKSQSSSHDQIHGAIPTSSSASIAPLGPANSSVANQAIQPSKRDHSMVFDVGDKNSVGTPECQQGEKRVRIEVPTPDTQHVHN